jgi:hypothetical protein
MTVLHACGIHLQDGIVRYCIDAQTVYLGAAIEATSDKPCVIADESGTAKSGRGALGCGPGPLYPGGGHRAGAFGSRPVPSRLRLSYGHPPSPTRFCPRELIKRSHPRLQERPAPGFQLGRGLAEEAHRVVPDPLTHSSTHPLIRWGEAFGGLGSWLFLINRRLSDVAFNAFTENQRSLRF